MTTTLIICAREEPDGYSAEVLDVPGTLSFAATELEAANMAAEKALAIFAARKAGVN